MRLSLEHAPLSLRHTQNARGRWRASAERPGVCGWGIGSLSEEAAGREASHPVGAINARLDDLGVDAGESEIGLGLPM